MNVADINILASFAAADALPLLLQALRVERLVVPVAVATEIEVGIARGRAHLQLIAQAMTAGQIEVMAKFYQ
ncbi:MAG: hypothetical protein ABI874_13235 [Chloroflexota bacterium]